MLKLNGEVQAAQAAGKKLKAKAAQKELDTFIEQYRDFRRAEDPDNVDELWGSGKKK